MTPVGVVSGGRAEPVVGGLDLRVRGLDAVDGSPVLDVKPWMRELAPRGEVRQPPWSRLLIAR